MTKGELFKIRVGVVVLDESDRLLLVRQNKRPFWVLPGGKGGNPEPMRRS
jgi:ADP-ribose pyrophosphatase YjhB (NUDIX family)